MEQFADDIVAHMSVPNDEPWVLSLDITRDPED
jgi:hypothetical protein